jgi:photosystem II stability/assembly factor-like uncharacterized protein
MRKTSVLALMLVLAACSPTVGRKAQRSPSPSPSSSATSSPTPAVTSPPPPTRFAVRDSTWVSDSIGWVLGIADCGSRECYAIRHTTDAGRSWSTVPVPQPQLEGDVLCSNPPCLSGIRFATRSIGYAFGPDLYLTRDGGFTWTQQRAAEVVDIEISHGRAIRAVAGSTGCPAACSVHLESSNAGSSTWHRLSAPALDNVSDVILDGRAIYEIAYGNTAGGAENAHARIVSSTDDGKTWRTWSDPCGTGPHGENDARWFASQAGVLTVMCAPRLVEEPPVFVRRSTDGGRSFGPRRDTPDKSSDRLSAGSAQILAVTEEVNGRFVVVMSKDGGRSWRVSLDGPKVGRGQWGTWLGFEDSNTARVAFGGPSIWTTLDAGKTWRRSNPF